ncbi:RnfABCDGE type electron transport complex subunit B [Neisseria leonii]|uniref:RnfABCDGE type electron transport complex subunit B n=1 Tax=Neisseria leonii TaxID=2995413 RepID=UPI00237B07AB|nr:RnfABCDGE type electron transport complex subunit B [Neisseria sp. 3986]MDD9325664.1 RnfABCDGE type electron transport complex subunit B [Neisseria sp. 3986]
MNPPAQVINRLLPQTQCRECGFSGCLPYAEALASGEAPLNLCAPGGETVIRDLAALLKQPPLPPAKVQPPVLAWIDEAVCIGCTACIRACPVDAILGASKQMHTVIADECTGCGLCVAPCPVDCIHLQPVPDRHLPRARTLATAAEPRFAAAEHARLRYEQRQGRLKRDTAEKKSRLAEREAAAKARLQNTSAATAPNPLNPAALIAQAMKRAAEQQTRRTVPANRESFQARQIQEAQQKALFRRYQRDARYGSEAEKNTAIAWLRRYKEEQEAHRTDT